MMPNREILNTIYDFAPNCSQPVASTKKKPDFRKTLLDAPRTEQAENRPSFSTVMAVKHMKEEESGILGDFAPKSVKTSSNFFGQRQQTSRDKRQLQWFQ